MENKKTKVIIGIPSSDMVHADFAMSLVNMVAFSALYGVQIAIVNQRSSVIEIGRCEICDRALDYGADKLLFLDSDMTFPPNTLVELLSHKLNVTGCDAMKRREPFTSVVRGLDGELIDYAKIGAGDKRPVEIAGASTACLLIDLEVIKKIEKPFFCVNYVGDNVFLGEDFYFSNKVRTAGYKIFCDLKLSREIGHIGCRTYFIQPGSLS